MIVSHAIKPFRFGEISIGKSIWIDGKPFVTPGKKLRAAMDRNGFSLKQLSALTGISVVSLSHYCTDLKTPSFAFQETISSALGVDAADIWDS